MLRVATNSLSAMAILLAMVSSLAPRACLGQYPYRFCPPDMEGCAPRRHTFGYYETTWRQWPVQKPTVAAPQAESVPTPAPVEPKRAEPSREREAAPRGEERRESEQPRPSTEPPSSLFDDMPTLPPQETPPSAAPPQAMPPQTTPESAVPEIPSLPAEPSPLEGLPTLPSPSSTTPADRDDAPPRMPDDDPFKDDPPEPPKSSSDDAPQPRMLGARTARSEPVGPATARHVAQPEARQAIEPRQSGEPPVVSQPKLLPASDEAVQRSDGKPDARPVRTNSLRETTPSANGSEVVSAAHWTRGEDAAGRPTSQRRTNPLRDR